MKEWMHRAYEIRPRLIPTGTKSNPFKRSVFLKSQIPSIITHNVYTLCFMIFIHGFTRKTLSPFHVEDLVNDPEFNDNQTVYIDPTTPTKKTDTRFGI